jgi:hypothetical protein
MLAFECSCALCRVRRLFEFYDDAARPKVPPLKRGEVLTDEERRERKREQNSSYYWRSKGRTV